MFMNKNDTRVIVVIDKHHSVIIIIIVASRPAGMTLLVNNGGEILEIPTIQVQSVLLELSMGSVHEGNLHTNYDSLIVIIIIIIIILSA